jgi:general secretion pathway protein B
LEQPQLVIAPPQEPGQLNPDAAAERLEASPGEVAKEAEKGGDRLEPYVSEPLSYWQMPQSLRDSMPPLHITVLVYAEKPSDRFLLINGERLHEKETLSDGLVLEEIQRDRAIFTYRNYRFQVKS